MRNLSELYTRFAQRTDLLVRDFDAPSLARTCTAIHAEGQVRLLIRLQHLWAEFCRELITRSALGSCRTISGSLLTRVPRVNKVRDILGFAKKESKGGFCPWHDPVFALGVANRLAVQNLSQMSLGLGAVSPANDLTAMRNYAVHPNKRTRTHYEQVTYKIGIPGAQPAELLATRQTGGATLFETWVADLQLIALIASR